MRGRADNVVMSLASVRLRSIREQILRHRTQLGLCVRTTVAAVASFLIAELLHVRLPLWTVLTAVILTQASFGKSLKATFDYLLGTLGGAIYAGGVAALIPHTSEIGWAGTLAVAVAPLALLGAVNPRFTVASFTGVLVLMVPQIAHVSPIESAVYRVVEVAIGATTAVLVSFVVFPARANSLALEAVAEMLDFVARSLPELFTGFMQEREATANRRIQDGIGGSLARLDAIAAEAKHEQIGLFTNDSNVAPLLRTLLRLRHDVVIIGRAATIPLPERLRTRLGPSLASVAHTVSDHLSQSGEAVAARRDPPPLNLVEAALDRCAEAFVAVRDEGLMGGLAVDAMERMFALAFALEQMRQNLRDLERRLSEIAGAK
jgi:uncharacterized membrane protein YccC